MHVFEKVAGFARQVMDKVTQSIRATYTIRVFLSNGTDAPLEVRGTPHGTAEMSFAQLDPGHAGFVCVEGEGEVGGAVEFSLGAEILVLGACIPRVGSSSFCLTFEHRTSFLSKATSKTKDDLARRYYKRLPKEFLGTDGAKRLVAGKAYAAYVGHVARGGATTYVHVLVGPAGNMLKLEISQEINSQSLVAPGVLASFVFLEQVEWCQKERPQDLAKAVFLMEIDAVQAGLGGMDLADQAFAIDLLVSCFVANDLLGLGGRTLSAELEEWRAKSAQFWGETRQSRQAQAARNPQYHVYRNLAADAEDGVDGRLGQHVATGLLVLKSAALQCSLALPTRAPKAQRGETARWGKRCENMTQDTNCDVMMSHLAARNGDDASSSSLGSRDAEAEVMATAQQCVHDAAEFSLRRQASLAALAEHAGERAGARSFSGSVAPTANTASGNGAQDVLQHYRAWGPPGKCRFAPPAGDGEAVPHEFWGADVLSRLDGGRSTDPQQLIQSLGRGAPPYKTMVTNSKSGEFFFFSADRHFLIKTITEDEATLLFRMLAACQGHFKRVPKSQIVRYAGLHCAYSPLFGKKYFTVMSSVFDPAYKIHETYDVKGSTLHRRKKKGESIGKDQDWVDAGLRLRLPSGARVELRGAHEQDVAFLASFGVMDYSLLIGVHHGAGGDVQPPLGGLRAVDGPDIYFVGLIDFLVAFGFYKHMEHILRVTQGHGEAASCVDPLSYATRQVDFVREKVLARLSQAQLAEARPSAGGSSGPARRQPCRYATQCYQANDNHKRQFAHPGDADWDPQAPLAMAPRATAAPEDAEASGTWGALRVAVVEASDLRNADFGGLSDPYLVVSLGMQRARTPVFKNTLNPKWNCVLRLAVDEAHKNAIIDLSVWDFDSVRSLEGSDDFLGKLQMPLLEVLQSPAKLDAKLQGTHTGRLVAELEFMPTAACCNMASFVREVALSAMSLGR